ncbi:LysR substrate-binding domain-containing protein [Rhizobium grahamii]|uniref:LysR substrate-binding domain-containing protein n=1 Tax=Rhizobium grahamii TaxID=1120045 RepID=A0A370KHU7_9HYPH|nr:hypothetical protein B5K06_25880 [Rhizobium grahamii]
MASSHGSCADGSHHERASWDSRERYPGIELAIGLNDRRVDLVQEGVDGVIRTGPLADSTLIARKLGSYRWVTCAAPTYIAEHGTPVEPSDLTRRLVVGYFSGSPGQERWSFGQEGEARETVMVSSEISVNETSAYLKVGLDGFGIIRLADDIVDPFIRYGRLIEIMPDRRSDQVPISLLYPTSRHLSHAVIQARILWRVLHSLQ